MSAQPSEKAAVVATIDPIDQAASSAANSDYVDMGKFHEALAVVLVGNTDRTVDAKIQEAQDSGGTGVQDLSGKAITQLSGTDDNKQAVINVKSDELSDGFTHIRLVVTPGAGGTATLIAGTVLGMEPRLGPASDDDLASVAEIVT